MEEKTVTVSELKNLKEFQGRKVLFVAKVGSVNYNLHDELSDEDFKVYVLPTFDDLYSGKRYVKSVVTDVVDYTVHDVRDFAQQLKKSNVNFVEVLFTSDLTLHEPALLPLFEMREQVARMNLPYFYDACFGMLYNKLKTFEKGTGGTNTLVEKYGYDTKSFMTMYRMMDFLMRYEEKGFTSFLEAVRYTDEERAYMLSLKQGLMSKEEAMKTVEEMKLKLEEKKAVYKSHTFQEETYAEVEELLKKLVQDAVQK